MMTSSTNSTPSTSSNSTSGSQTGSKIITLPPTSVSKPAPRDLSPGGIPMDTTLWDFPAFARGRSRSASSLASNSTVAEFSSGLDFDIVGNMQLYKEELTATEKEIKWRKLVGAPIELDAKVDSLIKPVTRTNAGSRKSRRHRRQRQQFDLENVMRNTFNENPEFDPSVDLGLMKLKNDLVQLKDNIDDYFVKKITPKQRNNLRKKIMNTCSKIDRHGGSARLTMKILYNDLSTFFENEFDKSLEELDLTFPIDFANNVRRLAEQPTGNSRATGALLIPVGIALYMIYRILFKRSKSLIPTHETDDASN